MTWKIQFKKEILEVHTHEMDYIISTWRSKFQVNCKKITKQKIPVYLVRFLIHFFLLWNMCYSCKFRVSMIGSSILVFCHRFTKLANLIRNTTKKSSHANGFLTWRWAEGWQLLTQPAKNFTIVKYVVKLLEKFLILETYKRLRDCGSVVALNMHSEVGLSNPTLRTGWIFHELAM
jgi:hypothetical protein